jgi:uncharacterized damage-inducible protein DinB
MLTLLLRYTNYNTWANQRLLTLIRESLSEEQLDVEIISSFPSIRKTVYHIWDAETIWLNRLKKIQLSGWPSKEFAGSFEEAANLLQDIDNEFSDLVSGFTNEQLNVELQYKSIAGQSYSNRVCDMVMHCVNHSTYHRGQLITMLRQAEVTNIPTTDYIAFFR